MADGICNNCGAVLVGPFCRRCGQQEADTEWRSIGAGATYVILLPYMFAALRRIYAEPPQPTLAKTVAILLLAFIIDSPISVAALWLSVRLS